MDLAAVLERECREYLDERVKEFLASLANFDFSSLSEEFILEEAVYGAKLVEEAAVRHGCKFQFQSFDKSQTPNKSQVLDKSRNSVCFAALYLRLRSLELTLNKLTDLNDALLKWCLNQWKFVRAKKCANFQETVLWQALLLCLERIFSSENASAWYASWNPNPTDAVCEALASQCPRLVPAALKVVKSMLSSTYNVFSTYDVKIMGKYIYALGPLAISEFVCEILAHDNSRSAEFVKENMLHERYIELILDEDPAAKHLGKEMFLAISSSRLGEMFSLNGCIHAEFYLVKHSVDFLKECTKKVSSQEDFMDVFRTGLHVLLSAAEVCKCECKKFKEDIICALRAVLLGEPPKFGTVFAQLAELIQELASSPHASPVKAHILKAVQRFAIHLAERRKDYAEIIIEYISCALSQNALVDFPQVGKTLNEFPLEVQQSCIPGLLCFAIHQRGTKSPKFAVETAIQILKTLNEELRDKMLECLLEYARAKAREDTQYAAEIIARVAPFAHTNLLLPVVRLVLENMHKFAPECVENIFKACTEIARKQTLREDWESLAEIYCISLANSVAFLYSPYVELYYASIETLAICLSGKCAPQLFQAFDLQVKRASEVLQGKKTLSAYQELLGDKMSAENLSIVSCIRKACEDSLVRRRLAQPCVRYLEIMARALQDLKQDFLEELFFKFGLNIVLKEYLKILEDELLFKSRQLALDSLLQNKKTLLETGKMLAASKSPRLAALSEDISAALCKFECKIDFQGISEKYLLADRIKETILRMQNGRRCEGYFECFEC